MKVKELFELAKKEKYVDLQALIMFLVLEKKVITLEDDSKELDLYFLEKHRERMNKELHAYKQKMGIRYAPKVFKFIKSDSDFRYVYAKSLEQAKLLIARENYDWNDVKIKELNLEMSNGLTLDQITAGKEPQILGGL